MSGIEIAIITIGSIIITSMVLLIAKYAIDIHTSKKQNKDKEKK